MATVIGGPEPDMRVRVPPNTVTKNPSAIAQYIPDAAPRPDAVPKASARGRETRAVVNPPDRSPLNVLESHFIPNMCVVILC